MKMELNIGERLVLLQILPRENNFLTLKTLRTLSEAVGIKDEEFKKYKIEHRSGGQISWNDKGKEGLEFEIGEKALEIIQVALADLDKSKKLEQKHFTLYEKFVKMGK